MSDKYSFDSLTFSLKAFYTFYRGETEQAINYFKTSNDNDPTLVNPIYGLGLLEFNRKNY